MRQFIAINDLPGGERETRDALERLAAASRVAGLRPVETMLSARRAYTFWEADTEEHVRRLLEGAGLPVVEVVPGKLIYTELLASPVD